MPIIIDTNDDMPTSLNTSRKQNAKAKRIASEYSVIVQLEDKTEVVVQFRPEVLDITPFRVAKSVLGSFIPDIVEIEDEALSKDGIWIYVMTCVPNQMADDARDGHQPTARISYCRSLGDVFSKAQLATNSSEAIENYIRPHVQQLLDSDNPTIAKFHEEITRLYKRLDDMKKLPLFVAHYDLNELNFAVDPSIFEVTGIIDWELSQPLPLGMGFERIHVLAGEYVRGEFVQPPEFEEAERGFWEAFQAGLQPEAKTIIEKDPLLVQDAVKLGTILGSFMLEEGKLGSPGEVSTKALPVHLTYQLPMIRGDGPPYKSSAAE